MYVKQIYDISCRQEDVITCCILGLILAFLLCQLQKVLKKCSYFPPGFSQADDKNRDYSLMMIWRAFLIHSRLYYF